MPVHVLHLEPCTSVFSLIEAKTWNRHETVARASNFFSSKSRITTSTPRGLACWKNGTRTFIAGEFTSTKILSLHEASATNDLIIRLASCSAATSCIAKTSTIYEEREKWLVPISTPRDNNCCSQWMHRGCSEIACVTGSAGVDRFVIDSFTRLARRFAPWRVAARPASAPLPAAIVAHDLMLEILLAPEVDDPLFGM